MSELKKAKSKPAEIIAGIVVVIAAIWWFASGSVEKEAPQPVADNKPSVSSAPTPADTEKDDDPQCKAVALMARFMVEKRESGLTLKRQIAEIKKNVADPRAQETMIDLADQIYTKPWANKLTPDGAQASYYADCLVSKSPK